MQLKNIITLNLEPYALKTRSEVSLKKEPIFVIIDSIKE